MSLGLYLKGRSRHATLRGESLRQALHAWALEHFGEEHVQDLEEDSEPLRIEVHASAPEVEVSFEGEDLLRVSAQTSPAGPGYHAWLCDALRQLGSRLSLHWLSAEEDEESRDETGFFETQDYTALEDVMLAWLREVCTQAARLLPSQVALGLPTSHTFEGGPVLTPLGPRDETWLQAVIAEPRRGLDFFPWWERGLGAGARLGGALSQMWLELRWRPPEDEEEEAALHEVIDSLQRAFAQDARREYPWREWAELLEHLDTEEEDPVARLVRARAEEPGPRERPLIGYRRAPVRVRLPADWSVRLPGEFSEGWDEEGTFVAGAEDRAVWISLYSSQEANTETESLEERPETLPREEKTLSLKSEHWVGSARLESREAEGERSFVLHARLVKRPQLALLTVQYLDPGDRTWALELVHSVEAPPSGPPRSDPPSEG